MEPKDFLALWAKPAISESNNVLRLLKFLLVARQKKMTMFSETSMQLIKVHSDHLQSINGPPLEIKQADLLALIKSSDVPIVHEAYQLIESAGHSEPIHKFELEFAHAFIRDCMVTTFPDYRQKFMKSVMHFFIRLRTVYYKDIKNGNNVDVLVEFLRKVIDICQHNLYLDKPIEGSFPLFDILKSI